MIGFPREHRRTDNSDVIHSIYKSKQTHSIPFMVDNSKSKDNNVRWSECSPEKMNSTYKQDSVTYLSYPSVFKNKSTNIKSMLLKKDGFDHLGRVLKCKKNWKKYENVFRETKKQKEEFSIRDFYGFRISTNNIYQELQKKITIHAQSGRNQVIEEVVRKKGGWSKRRANQRVTEPIERGLKQKLIPIGEFKNRMDVNLSPWGGDFE